MSGYSDRLHIVKTHQAKIDGPAGVKLECPAHWSPESVASAHTGWWAADYAIDEDGQSWFTAERFAHAPRNAKLRRADVMEKAPEWFDKINAKQGVLTPGGRRGVWYAFFSDGSLEIEIA